MKKHKVRLLAKGYEQKHKVGYDEIFALVARLDTIILIISMEAQRKFVTPHFSQGVK